MDSNEDSSLLQGIKIVSLALNAPGPVAAARLTKLGAEVTKVEPPSGDATSRAAPGWYESLCEGQTILRLDLKSPDGRAQLDDLLAQADLLLASFRPSALQGWGWIGKACTRAIPSSVSWGSSVMLRRCRSAPATI